MARGGAVTGAPSAPLPDRTPETWVCSSCGRKVEINVPASKPEYPHNYCPERPAGKYRPIPGREESA